jgi:hypothetical protein
LDRFEFVQIPVAIILGFAISEILAGWGHQLRHRDDHPFSRLHFMGSAYILMMALRYLWVQWATRPDSWDYVAYLLTMAPPVLIALAAHSIRFDPTVQQTDQHSLYDRSRKPVCWLLACLFPVWMARIFYIVAASSPSPSPSPPPPLLILGGFLLSTLVFLRLATTSRPREQWIGWSICWAIMLGLITVVLPDLSPVR